MSQMLEIQRLSEQRTRTVRFHRWFLNNDEKFQCIDCGHTSENAFYGNPICIEREEVDEPTFTHKYINDIRRTHEEQL